LPPPSPPWARLLLKRDALMVTVLGAWSAPLPTLAMPPPQALPPAPPTARLPVNTLSLTVSDPPKALPMPPAMARPTKRGPLPPLPREARLPETVLLLTVVLARSRLDQIPPPAARPPPLPPAASLLANVLLVTLRVEFAELSTPPLWTRMAPAMAKPPWFPG